MSNRRPQVSATIDQELYDSIVIMADGNDRSVSEMVALLLKQAVKDKTRNRKGEKKDNTEYNPG
jgi:hypothetical protein